MRAPGTRARAALRAGDANRTYAFPLGIWLGALASVLAVAALLGYDPFAPATWTRWDATLYLDVARDGYELFRCPPESGLTGWCGDAGWFPAYSWLAGGLHVLGLPLPVTAMLLSWTLAGVTVVLLWSTLLERATGRLAAVALAYAAFAPGQVYLYAIFPLSLLTAATVLHLWLLQRERWFASGLAGAVAALAYPVGLAVAPVALVWIALRRTLSARARLRAAVLTAGPVAAALAVLALVQWAETGRADAYFLVQEKYGHELQDPLRGTWSSLRPLFDLSSATAAQLVALQTLLVSAVLVAVLGSALARRRHLSRAEPLLLLWALATWAVPLTQTHVSEQRGQAALVPLAVLVASLPYRLALVLAAAAVAVAVLIEAAFLYGSIV